MAIRRKIADRRPRPSSRAAKPKKDVLARTPTTRSASAMSILSAAHNHQLDKDNFFAKIEVEFGPAFSNQPSITDVEMAKRLRQHAAQFKSATSPIRPLLLFFAEHFELMLQEGHGVGKMEPKIVMITGGCPSCDAAGSKGSWWCCDNPHPGSICVCRHC